MCYTSGMTLENFARKKKHLFWSTKNYKGLSSASIVEGILNYGDMNDVQELIDLLGIQEVARIFQSHTKQKTRTNYRPEVVNYFRLFFHKYV